MDRACTVAILLPFVEVPLLGDHLGDRPLPCGGGGEEGCHAGGRQELQPPCPEWESWWSHTRHLWHLLMVQVTILISYCLWWTQLLTKFNFVHISGTPHTQAGSCGPWAANWSWSTRSVCSPTPMSASPSSVRESTARSSCCSSSLGRSTGNIRCLTITPEKNEIKIDILGQSGLRHSWHFGIQGLGLGWRGECWGQWERPMIS